MLLRFFICAVFFLSPLAPLPAAMPQATTNIPAPQATAEAPQPAVYRVPSDYAYFTAERTIPPAYPTDALQKKISGEVILIVQYSTAGNVEGVERIKGNPLLLKTCLEAVSEWKFKPLKVKGEKAKGVTYVGFHFILPTDSADEPKVHNIFPYGTWQPSPDLQDKTEETKAPTGMVRISSGVLARNKISGSNPVYPQSAKTNRIQGVVILKVIIDKQGSIKLLEVVSSPSMDLAISAINAVGTWRYSPYTLNGEPLEVESVIQVNYTLRG